MQDYEQLKEALRAHLEIEMDLNGSTGCLLTTIRFQGEKITESYCYIPGIGRDGDD